MPSAEELRALADDENRISVFIRNAEMDARGGASQGDKSVFVEAPKGIPAASIEKALKEAFPGCGVMHRSLTRLYRVSWA
jgi:hypothetical protein